MLGNDLHSIVTRVQTITNTYKPWQGIYMTLASINITLADPGEHLQTISYAWQSFTFDCHTFANNYKHLQTLARHLQHLHTFANICKHLQSHLHTFASICIHLQAFARTFATICKAIYMSIYMPFTYFHLWTLGSWQVQCGIVHYLERVLHIPQTFPFPQFFPPPANETLFVPRDKK